MSHKSITGITAAVVFAAANIAFAPSVSAATTQYWVVSSSPPKYQTLVRSVNLSTGTAKTWRKISLLNLSYGPAMTPDGKILYVKEIGKTGTSWHKVGMYLTDAANSFERLLSSGYACTGDPCPSPSTVLNAGSFSSNGKLVSYSKGPSSKILNLSTGIVTVLPWKNVGPVSFSPKGTFVYATEYGDDSSTLRWKKLSSTKTHSVSLKKTTTGRGGYLIGTAVSPDERYMATGYSTRTWNKDTSGWTITGKIFLIDLNTGKVVNSIPLTTDVGSRIIWVSNRSFIYEHSNGESNELTRYFIERVRIVKGKMSQTRIPISEESRGWEMRGKIDTTSVLFSRLDDASRSVYELASLDVDSGIVESLYMATNMPAYYFNPVGPKK